MTTIPATQHSPTDLREKLTEHDHRTFESHKQLYHVGNLETERNTPYFSQEGGELSVSHVPAEWRRITKHVGGDTYELRNPDGEFYAVDPITTVTPTEESICTDAGFITMENGYRVNYTAENGDNAYMLFTSRSDAEDKHDFYRDATISTEQIPALDEKGKQYCNTAFKRDASSLSPIEIRMLLPIWAASLLDVDGVYWHHPLHVAELFAPRGLIYQDQLENWDRTQI